MIKTHTIVALKPRPQLLTFSHALLRQLWVRHIVSLGLDGMVPLAVSNDMK